MPMKQTLNLHLFSLIGFFIPIPFANVAMPWIYWKLKEGRSGSELSQQACNVLNFQFLVACIYWIAMGAMWYHFVKALAAGQEPEYAWLAYPIGFYAVCALLYPLCVSIYVGATRKAKLFYPKTIKLFK